jgi:hypothetical protein
MTRGGFCKRNLDDRELAPARTFAREQSTSVPGKLGEETIIGLYRGANEPAL